ncbi:hypothetical protein BOX15_Mlig008312g1 [Macrostomum lignano]|uniref:Uncharacterized protein n=1 Tax=Macrostomum lignano TaxID=282301 RepID=A0A267GZ10_9PLAT|nr:hypothetical protein BOX15_Mlig008312g1 [Macrostomum lignano]
MALLPDLRSGPLLDGEEFQIDSDSENGDADIPTPCATPTGEEGEAAAEPRRGLLGRIAFLEAEAEKLIEHSRGCRGHADEMQSLLARLHDQKAALQRLLGAGDAGPELDSWEEPCDLTEHTARAYLQWLRRLLHDLSQAVDQAASGAVLASASAAGATAPRLSGRRRRDAPSRIFPNLEALDIAAVDNGSGDVFHQPGEAGDLRDSPGEGGTGWEPLPRQALYCVVGDARRVTVVGLGGQLLARTRLRGGGCDEQEAEAGSNLERINYLRCSGRLLLSDNQSLYICDRCCRVLRCLHGFSWVVGHCVDEPADRLYIVDRVNEFLSVYGLARLGELDRLAHRDFTDGISSVTALARTLFVADRGANAIFAFETESLQLAFRVPLRSPLFITSDWRGGCLYVTVGGRDNTVRMLDGQGQLRRSLSGGRGSQPGQFGSPGGLTVSLDGTELFVCDLDNRRVQVFGLGG